MDYYVPSIAKAHAEQMGLYSDDHMKTLQKTLDGLTRRLTAMSPGVYQNWTLIARDTRAQLGKLVVIQFSLKNEQKEATTNGRLTRVKKARLCNFIDQGTRINADAAVDDRPTLVERHCQVVCQVIAHMKKQRRLRMLQNRLDVASKSLLRKHSKYLSFTRYMYHEYWRVVTLIQSVKKKIDLVTQGAAKARIKYKKDLEFMDEIWSTHYVHGDDCPICMEDGEKLVTSKCGHTFHPLCIMQYVHVRITAPGAHTRLTGSIGKKAPCPMCREINW